MKEVVKSKTVSTVVYQASDGTEFVDKTECIKYEESAKCVLFGRYNKLVVESKCEETIFKTGSCDDMVDIVKVNSQEDIDIILQIFYYFNSNPSTSYLERVENSLNSSVGSFLFINRGYDNDGFYIMTSLPEYVKHLENICNEIN